MKILRELNNYTQEYVASFLGINQNSYYRLESGQTRLTVDRMKKLSELYDVEPEIFLSNAASIVHYNKGIGSNSNSGYIQTYKNGISEEQKKLYEKIIAEKDTQIILLNEQLKEYREKERQLLLMIEKISAKV